MDDLMELAGRVERATGADAELEALIRCALFAPADAYVEQSRFNGAWCIYRGEYQGSPRLFERPRNCPLSTWQGEYTASLDAAVSLLPASNAATAVFWKLGNDGEGGDPSLFKATILVAHVLTSKSFSAVADTAMLALTAACLKAHSLPSANEAGR